MAKHYFHFKNMGMDGKWRYSKYPAKVCPGKEPVVLKVEAEYVRRSIELDGAGNTQTCAGAVCVFTQKDQFPHEVVGYIDFYPYRVFIGSKLDKYGMPCECYVYEHSHKGFTKLNDTPGGQQKLLKLIEKKGPLHLRLRPMRKRSDVGKPSGSRKSKGIRKRKGVGHTLRRAISQPA